MTHNSKGVNIENWVSEWNDALWFYNGAPTYPGAVRNREKKYFIPIVKE